ncbi:MAG: sulfotransferase [Gammaproteobacteria bacterium]
MSRDIIPAATFRRQSWRRALGNFALLKARHCDGQLVSMHQSGTHWLKFMLANALAHRYDIPPPRYNHANDIIGGPKDPVQYPAIPCLKASHSMPHPLLRHAIVHDRLALPHYVVLVRDLRAALVSNYAKWAARYDEPFSVYLRGDPRGKRYNSDVWWAIRFLNAWGELLERLPARVMLLRYEDLRADSARELARVATHFALDLGAADIAHGVAVSGKAAMAAKDDPSRPPGAVRATAANPLDEFAAADRAFLIDVCARHLRHPLGYDYTHWG